MGILEAVTLDFHDTLFQCDDWFQLEVQTLAPRILEWSAGREGRRPSIATLENARLAYRNLRTRIIQSGEEQDALACVLHASRAAGVTLRPADAERGIAELMRAALDSVEPTPGAIEAVRALAGRGLRLAVISNAVYHPFLLWALKQHDVLDAFDLVLSSASARFYKSRPEIYHQAVAALGVAACGALHVGDSYEYDVCGAARAGLRTAWLRPSRDCRDGSRADVELASLLELPHAVRALDDRLYARATDAD